jgi:hypothetical protein
MLSKSFHDTPKMEEDDRRIAKVTTSKALINIINV